MVWRNTDRRGESTEESYEKDARKVKRMWENGDREGSKSKEI